MARHPISADRTSRQPAGAQSLCRSRSSRGRKCSPTGGSTPASHTTGTQCTPIRGPRVALSRDTTPEGGTCDRAPSTSWIEARGRDSKERSDAAERHPMVVSVKLLVGFLRVGGVPMRCSRCRGCGF